MNKKHHASVSTSQDFETIDLSSLTLPYRRLWVAKVEFNKKKLGLSSKKAKEWASRTVNVLINGAQEAAIK